MRTHYSKMNKYIDHRHTPFSFFRERRVSTVTTYNGKKKETIKPPSKEIKSEEKKKY